MNNKFLLAVWIFSIAFFMGVANLGWIFLSVHMGEGIFYSIISSGVVISLLSLLLGVLIKKWQ